MFIYLRNIQNLMGDIQPTSTSTIMDAQIISTIQAHEDLFRNILRDAKLRRDDLPVNLNPDATLESLLRRVKSEPRTGSPRGFSIYMFTIGPADFSISPANNPDQSIPCSVADDQVAFGYDSVGAMDYGSAIMLYQILSNNQVEFVSDIVRVNL